MKRERNENETDGQNGTTTPTRCESRRVWRVAARSSVDGGVPHGHGDHVVMEYESSEWIFRFRWEREISNYSGHESLSGARHGHHTGRGGALD